MQRTLKEALKATSLSSIIFYRILAFGGNNRESNKTNQIEVWDEEKETWSEAPYSMGTDRYNFGYLAVPESVICAQILGCASRDLGKVGN